MGCSPGAACAPAVLRYLLEEMASVMLSSLPSGVSSFSRWSRNTKQSLSGLLTSFVHSSEFDSIVYICPGCSKLCFGWEGLENWLAPKAFLLQILVCQFSALVLLLMM